MVMNKEDVILRLKGINIEGMDNLIEYLNTSSYFIDPASKNRHGCHDGGLLEHSVHLYRFYMNTLKNMKKFSPDKFEDCPTDDDIFLCAILHDLCKVGSYVKISEKNYGYKITHPPGHAILSLSIIKKFINLTPIQEALVRYHMGYYGTHQFGNKGEYDIQTLCVAQNNKYVKLFYFADDIVTQFWDK
jgi:hypothetical protein